MLPSDSEAVDKDMPRVCQACALRVSGVSTSRRFEEYLEDLERLQFTDILRDCQLTPPVAQSEGKLFIPVRK